MIIKYELLNYKTNAHEIVLIIERECVVDYNSNKILTFPFEVC